MKLKQNATSDALILDIYDVFIKDKTTQEVLAYQRLTQVDLAMTTSNTEIRGN